MIAPQPKFVGCDPMAFSTGSRQRIARAVCDQIGSPDVRFVDQLPLRAVVALQLRRRLRSVQPLQSFRRVFRGKALLNGIIQIRNRNLSLRNHYSTSHTNTVLTSTSSPLMEMTLPVANAAPLSRGSPFLSRRYQVYFFVCPYSALLETSVHALPE